MGEGKTFDFDFLLGLNCVFDEVNIGKLWRGGGGVNEGDDGVGGGNGGEVVGPGYIRGILLDLVRYSCLDHFVNATETAKHYPLVDRFNGLIRTQMIRYFDWRLAPRCYLGT